MKLDPAPITVFQEKTVPDGTKLAGWAALVHALGIPAPVRRPSCVSEQHIRGSHRKEGVWTVFDKRYWPGDTFADHITFALRHEEIDLLILKRVFEAVPQAEIEAIVHAAPTGIPARRAWYLYEILTGRTLDVEDAPAAAAVDLLDPEAYLPANRAFRNVTACATIFWAPAGFVRSSGAPRLSRNSWRSTSPPRRGKPWGAPAPIWLRAPPASCCWPTARPVSRSRASGRRATAWSDGAARSCRPVRTGSRLTKSSAFTASSSRTRDSYTRVCVPTASF